MTTYTATEFKAKCLEIFDRLASRSVTRVTVTKRGRVVAILSPPDEPDPAVRSLHGFMRGSVVASPDFDLTAPALDEPMGAEAGKLHG